MTPEDMATLHARSFDGAARWSARSFTDICADPTVFRVNRPEGFVLGRVVAGEAELLTIVVAESARGQGIGRALMHAFDARARDRDATEAFLEVAADNIAARALYTALNWAQVGHRAGYYGGTDALILRKSL